ncbi:MAG: LacI family transcriptional regulator [Clostridia bacterium]|nr:LacI family transcriptional regulator [Clostridia bacterium]
MKKAVTIKDIAEQLNLSRNTVAKALNGQYVPEKTRETVLKKAQEMKYKSLNVNHIEMGGKKYRILLVSGKPLNNMNYFVPLIKSIENNCFEKNYELFQYTHNGSKTPFKEVSDYISDLKVDGIVAIECFDKEFIYKLINLGKPVCFNDFCTAEIRAEKNYDIIGTNDGQSISGIVRALHRKYKITRFSFVGDYRHCRSFQERYNGMITGILSVGGTHSRNEDILCSDLTFNYGNPEAIKTEILKLKYRPDCFICCNDFVARGVCNALKSLNVAVPLSAFVVGFDNVSEAVANEPYLTTFSVKKEFLGTETIRTLINRIENPDIPSRIITVSTTLVARDSTNRIIPE